MTDLANALDNLRVHQRQLDDDGIMVGVSREALNEVIRAFGAISLRQYHSTGAVVKGEIAELIAWLRERAKPDSGIRYGDNSSGVAEASFFGYDAAFVVEHFHGHGATVLADALSALYLAALPAPDGLVERLREEIGGLRDVLAERDQCLDELEAEHGMPWRFWSKKAQDLATKLEAAEQQVRDILDALNWALGTTGEFQPSGVGTGPFWWRAELAARVGLTFDREAHTYRLLLKEGGE